MAYIYDEDLEFLKDCKNEELELLVNLLLFDSDGKTHLSSGLQKKDGFKLYFEQKLHTEYWQEIAEEIQLFGANTIASLVRKGKGVVYKEILQDVATKIGAKYEKGDSTLQIENDLIKSITNIVLSYSSIEEIKELKITGLTPANTDNKIELIDYFIDHLQGNNEKSYYVAECFIKKYIADLPKMEVIKKEISNVDVSNNPLAMGGLSSIAAGAARLATGASTIARAAGPIGWIVSAGAFAAYLASPAYRITTPVVLYIALLRKKKNTSFSITNKLPEAISFIKPKNKLGFVSYGIILIIIAFALIVFFSYEK